MVQFETVKTLADLGPVRTPAALCSIPIGQRFGVSPSLRFDDRGWEIRGDHSTESVKRNFCFDGA